MKNDVIFAPVKISPMKNDILKERKIARVCTTIVNSLFVLSLLILAANLVLKTLI